MAAATTTKMELRLVDIDDINDCPFIIFQTFLVSGGDPDGSGIGAFLSSTELLVETASAWVLT